MLEKVVIMLSLTPFFLVITYMDNRKREMIYE